MNMPIAYKSVVASLLALAASGGQAFTLDTGNPDLHIDWTQKLTLNTGWRMSSRDPAIANNPNYDEGEYLFDKGDMVAQRVDLFSEFDLSYQRRMGLRVSAALWADGAYGSSAQANPALASRNIPGGQFGSYVQRYYQGPAGELADAFVWSNLELDNGWDASMKLGRHALVWGVGLVGSTHAVSYGQAPSDGLKTAQSPGASAKETALPLNQWSGVLQVSNNLSLAAYRTFEWRPNRVPEAGTYYSASDVILASDTTVAGLVRGPQIKGRSGDWGVSAQWRPKAMDGALGFYYRRFDDKGGWLVQPDIANGQYHFVAARDVSLWGLSVNSTVGWLGLGAEVSYRQNGPLNTRSFAAGAAPYFEGAVGNTWHAVLNGMATVNQTVGWDVLQLSGELQFSRLDKVTRNAALYKVEGSAGCTSDPISYGCSTNSFVGVTLAVTPQWQQVWPGIDLEMPMTLIAHLHGNAPSVGGGSQGLRVWKLGLTAKLFARHQLDAAYTAYGARTLALPSGLLQLNPASPLVDRDTLTLTYRYDF